MSNRQDQTQNDAAASQSVVRQMLANPRILAFFAALLPANIAAGAIVSERLDFVTDSFGNESGIGKIAITFALGGAATAAPGGWLVDRWNPRHLLLISGVIGGLLSILTGLLLRGGTVPALVLILIALAEGAVAGLAWSAIPTTQAALVSHDARGSAEITNQLRNAGGALIGALLVGMATSASLVLIGGGAMIALSTIASWWVAAPAHFARADRHLDDSVPEVDTRTALRQLPRLRAAVIADVVMRFVVPSTLIYLLLVDRDIQHLTPAVIAAGVSGVLLGDLALAAIGLNGNLSRTLMIVFSGYAASLILGTALLTDDWLVRTPVLLVVLIALGTALSRYGQGLLLALVQQRTPDEIRGRLNGLLSIPRSLSAAGATALLTWIVTTGDSRLAGLFLAAIAVIAIIALNWFRKVGSRV